MPEFLEPPSERSWQMVERRALAEMFEAICGTASILKVFFPKGSIEKPMLSSVLSELAILAESAGESATVSGMRRGCVGIVISLICS